MSPRQTWESQPPVLRLALAALAGAVISVMCAESIALLGSGSMVGAIAPVAAGLSFASVAAYCWLRGDVVPDGREPSIGARRARNGLVVAVTALIAFGVAASFPMARGAFTSNLRLPLAALGAVAAVALAFVAIAVVRQEQAFFDWKTDVASGEIGLAEGALRHALHGARTSHGWAAVTAVASTAMIVAAGASPYVYPVAGLVLIPSLATWAYAALRMSGLDRRAARETSPHPPSGRVRGAHIIAVTMLAIAPAGVLASVLLGLADPSVGSTEGLSLGGSAGVVLMATLAIGLLAAIAYPFLTVAESLRTPPPIAHRPREADFEDIVAPLDLDFVHGRGQPRARVSSAA